MAKDAIRAFHSQLALSKSGGNFQFFENSSDGMFSTPDAGLFACVRASAASVRAFVLVLSVWLHACVFCACGRVVCTRIRLHVRMRAQLCVCVRGDACTCVRVLPAAPVEPAAAQTRPPHGVTAVSEAGGPDQPCCRRESATRPQPLFQRLCLLRAVDVPYLRARVHV